jgi:parvulin-like peptidyl-prolyl isomerase
VFSRSLTTIALLAASAMLQAAIVDRIAIVVGDKIITESEIDLRVRLSAFQNEQKADLSLAARQLAAHELIDQRLVEHEMDVGHYPRLEGEARKALVSEYAKANYKAETAAMGRALAEYGLTAQDLEDDLGRQSDLLTFLNLRLRPVVAGVEQDPKVAEERTQKELDRWLEDQHTRTRIQYLDKDLESK